LSTKAKLAGLASPNVGAIGKEMSLRFAELAIDNAAGTLTTLAVGTDWELRWGFKISKIKVTGTPYPRQLHNDFDGQATCNYVYISDDFVAPLVCLANLDKLYTLKSLDGDIDAARGGGSQTKVSWTVECKLGDFHRLGDVGNGVAMGRIIMEMQTEPTQGSS